MTTNLSSQATPDYSRYSASVADEKKKSAANISNWRSKAAEQGLVGYFQRHGTSELLWQAVLRTLRSNEPKELTPFGEQGELYEFPSGDVVIHDSALAFKVQSFFQRKRSRFIPLPAWYRQQKERVLIHHSI